MSMHREVIPHGWILILALTATLVALIVGAYQFELGQTRSFRMGLIYWPSRGPATPEHQLDREAQLAANHAELLLCQVQWSPHRTISAGRYMGMARVARNANADFVLALEWLAPDRRRLLDAHTAAWSFAQPDVRAAFMGTVEQIVKRTAPHCVVLGVEVNYLQRISPDEFDRFVRLYQETRARIKQHQPHCQVTVSFQYELLVGRGPFDHATTDAIDAFQGELDLLGISTYPLLAASVPSGIPADYFKPLSEYSMPLAVFESAWPTRPALAPELAESRQRLYLERLLNECNRLNAELVVWTAAVDAPAPANIGPGTVAEGNMRWTSHLGLWQDAGQPKLSAEHWRKWLARPISPSRAAAK